MRPKFSGKAWLTGLSLLILGIIIACGSSSTSVPASQPTTASQPSATQAPAVQPTTAPSGGGPAATAIPQALPTATTGPAARVEPQGILQVAVPELGPVQFVLYNQGFEQFKFDGITTHEPMFRELGDGRVVGLLVESFDVDSSGKVFTLRLRKGAKWHSNFGDWGEFDADDFIFSVKQVSQEGSIHTAAGNIRSVFLCDECTLEKVDSHTIKLTRPTPTVELTWHSRQPEGSALSFHSKAHFEAVGEDAAALESVGTGPWMMVEAKSGEFREMEGVPDHWRRTPDWEGMKWTEIKEESTRLANFETGLIDAASLNTDSIQILRQKNLDGVQFMTFPGAVGIYLNILGQHYAPENPAHHPTADGKDARIPVAEGTEYFARCKELVYVSCDADTSSAEWERARKVREALAISIDRQKLVNNLALGEGAPAHLSQWWGHGARAASLGLDQLIYEFDPARARQLLEEAGVGGGFEIEFALPLRPGAAGAIVAGEAVAAMWQDIGVESILEKLPMSEYRGGFVRRSNVGVNAHNGNPPIEPLRNYAVLYNSENSLNFGFEHPFINERIKLAGATVDDDARWEILGEMGRFVFENVMSIPLYTQNAQWPIGPRIDTWDPLNRVYDWLSNWEEVPHR